MLQILSNIISFQCFSLSIMFLSLHGQNGKCPDKIFCSRNKNFIIFLFFFVDVIKHLFSDLTMHCIFLIAECDWFFVINQSILVLDCCPNDRILLAVCDSFGQNLLFCFGQNLLLSKCFDSYYYQQVFFLLQISLN